jgi:hypothetical protein
MSNSRVLFLRSTTWGFFDAVDEVKAVNVGAMTADIKDTNQRQVFALAFCVNP